MTARNASLEQVTRWGKLPAWWLLHPNVDADRLAVMAALTTYADEEGFCEPSQATLGKRLARSRPWVNRVVADLAALGLLRKQGRQRSNGGTTSCRYQLAQTPEQAETFAAKHTPEGGVPAVTPLSRRQDTACHRGDTSHVDLEQSQNSRPEAHGTKETEPGVAASNVTAGAPLAGPTLEDRAEPSREWLPSEATVTEALRLCPDADLDEHTARFVSRCRAKGYRYASLDDAWLDWLLGDRRDQRLAATRPQPAVQGRPGTARYGCASDHRLSRFDAWAIAATSPRCGDASR
jgi:hypothetical protein